MINFKLTITLLIATLFLMPSSLIASTKWGKTGHRVVGEIAEKHLTGKTKRQLAKLLDNRSLAYSSTFADEIKSDERYDQYYNWHFINMPFETTYEQSVKNPKGDLVIGLTYCKRMILDEKTSDADKAFYLKLLIHLIGDLHQPMHIGLEQDRGGNDIKLKWFYKDTNLHSVWDSKMIDDYDMSYTELAGNLIDLSKSEVKALQKGTIVDWVNETQQLTKTIYASAKEGENLRNEYSYLYFGTVEAQLQKGGIRLAMVLNELFD